MPSICSLRVSVFHRGSSILKCPRAPPNSRYLWLNSPLGDSSLPLPVSTFTAKSAMNDTACRVFRADQDRRALSNTPPGSRPNAQIIGKRSVEWAVTLLLRLGLPERDARSIGDTAFVEATRLPAERSSTANSSPREHQRTHHHREKRDRPVSSVPQSSQCLPPRRVVRSPLVSNLFGTWVTN